MMVKVADKEWGTKGLEFDRGGREIHLEEEMFKYTELCITVYFSCPAEAKYCFNKYEYNETVNIITEEENHPQNGMYIERGMKVKGVDNCKVIFKKECAEGGLAAKLLSNTPTK